VEILGEAPDDKEILSQNPWKRKIFLTMKKVVTFIASYNTRLSKNVKALPRLKFS
jgi:hypothetical protein